MVRAGFSPPMVKLMASYLRDRMFVVTVGVTRSGKREVGAGVPQGSVLAPTLFNIYISDIPRVEGIELALFADDTAIFAQDKNLKYIKSLLQAQLEAVEEWAKS